MQANIRVMLRVFLWFFYDPGHWIVEDLHVLHTLKMKEMVLDSFLVSLVFKSLPIQMEDALLQQNLQKPEDYCL